MSEMMQSHTRARPTAHATPGWRDADPAPRSPALPARQKWAGWCLSGLAALFLGFDASLKLLQVQPALEGTSALGYPADVLFPIGVLQVVCLLLYLTPRTSVLGAILWTGYLGGAVASHVRVLNPLATHALFPVYIATMLWLGLWLRDRRLRALLPLS